MHAATSADASSSTRSTPSSGEVASALRGPVRVLAGAGTGKTRAITHRIAYGVASGVYNPHEVLAVTFTTRAAGEMRTRLRSLGAGGVQARTFHSAALRQARYFWPRVYGGDLPALTESKLGLIGNAARRNRVDDRPGARCVTWPARSSGPRSATSGPTTTPGVARRAAARSAARTPRRSRTCSRTLRGRQARAGPDGHGGRAAVRAPRSSPRTSGSPPRSASSTSGSSSTSSRTSARSRSALLDLWLGGRDDLCVVGDPAQTIYSFAGARAVVPPGLPAAPTSGTTSVELVRNYRSTPQVVDVANRLLAGTPSAGVQLRCAAARPAPRRDFAEHPDEVAEAEQSRATSRALHRRRRPGCARWRCCSGSTPSPRRSRRRCAARGIPYVVRGAARFFERPEVNRPSPLLRGNARGGEGSEARTWSTAASAPCWPAWAGRQRPPTGRGNARDRWESLQAIVVPGARSSSPAGADADARRTSSPSSTGGPPSSTPRSPRASRWRPCTPPRASSGTWCSWPACRRARCRSSTPTARPRSRRSAGCSTSA